MTESTGRKTLIRWLVLVIDVLAYFMLVLAIITFFEGYSPLSVKYHPYIAGTIGSLFVVAFSEMFPSVIYSRQVNVMEIVRRNVSLVLASQASFACLWHVLAVDSSNEINYNTIFAISYFFLLLLLRFLEKWMLGYLRSKGRNSRSVLFVGSDPANLAIYSEIMADPASGYNVLGYYSNNEIEGAPAALKKLGTRTELMEMVDDPHCSIGNVEELFCSLSHSDYDDIMKLMNYCDRQVIHFFYVPRIMHNLKMSLKPSMLGNNVVFTTHYEPLSLLSNKIKKRAFDIVFSSIVLLIMIPMIPVIWFIVRLQSPGPLFFKQERTGMNGKNFMCYKFRSMHVNSEADRRQATKDDPRKFTFGNFMRKTNIDELPQFLCVLKGDMSVVGPRPHMILHTEQYSQLIEKYMVRHFAKPGITGWAQITGFRGETEELWQMEGRIKKDIWYIEHWSFWLDVKICIITVWKMMLSDEQAY